MTPRPTTAALALVAAVGLAALSACDVTTGAGGSATATDQAPLTAPFDRLSVTTDGAVRIEPAAPGAGATVRRTVHYPGGPAPGGVVRSEGSTLVLDGHCGDDCDTDYVVTVPRGTPLRVDATAGPVSVSDMGASELISQAGDVRAERTAGDVTARTQAGAVTLSGVAGRATASAQAGAVTVTGVAGPADASSQAGAVSVAVTAPVDVTARTDAADVTITVPPGRYRVDARDLMGVPATAIPSDPTAPHTLTGQTSAGHVRILTG